MDRCWRFCVVAFFVAVATAIGAHAQNVDISQSSSISENTPVGAGIAETMQGFTQAAPELQEAQQLRDTQRRGTFVGAETGDLSTFVGAAEGGTTRAAQQGRLTGARSRMSSQPRQTQGPVVRPRLTVGFAYTPKVSPQVGYSVRTSLGRIPDFGKTSSIRVSIEKNVVVLEGTVASQHDSLLAAQMVALEPGVVKVDNRLKVAAQQATPSAGAP